MRYGLMKERRRICWSVPPIGSLKFNVDGAAKGKSGLERIGGVLRSDKGEVILMFPMNEGVGYFGSLTDLL